MNRMPFVAAFFAGLVAIAWVGAGYAGSHPLALSVLTLIAAFYLAGGQELRHYCAASASLATALAALPVALPAALPAASPPIPALTDATTDAQTDPLLALDSWLENIHPSLRNPVRLRIEGERIALPGPTLTP